MNKKLAFVAFLLIASSGFMLFAEFSKSPTPDTQMTETAMSLTWQFELDEASSLVTPSSCVTICDTVSCVCVRCCPSFSGWTCNPTLPAEWCQ